MATRVGEARSPRREREGIAGVGKGVMHWVGESHRLSCNSAGVKGLAGHVFVVLLSQQATSVCPGMRGPERSGVAGCSGPYGCHVWEVAVCSEEV